MEEIRNPIPNPLAYADYAREMAWSDRGFPVDPVTIAQSFGVPVYKVELPGDVSGAIRKSPGRDPEIYVNATDSDSRKRFTIAHECGHYFYNFETGRADFDYIDYRDANSSTGDRQEEVFANQFAAHLLMPEKEVRSQYRKNQSVGMLAHYFGVSPEAMGFRLKNLRIT